MTARAGHRRTGTAPCATTTSSAGSWTASPASTRPGTGSCTEAPGSPAATVIDDRVVAAITDPGRPGPPASAAGRWPASPPSAPPGRTCPPSPASTPRSTPGCRPRPRAMPCPAPGPDRFGPAPVRVPRAVPISTLLGRARQLLGTAARGLRVVTCHLGAGASLAAVRDGGQRGYHYGLHTAGRPGHGDQTRQRRPGPAGLAARSTAGSRWMSWPTALSTPPAWPGWPGCRTARRPARGADRGRCGPPRRPAGHRGAHAPPARAR